MIYVFKRDGLIYITNIPRNKEVDERNRTPTELIYVFQEENIERLYKILRPWKVLSRRNPEWFKLSCLNYIENHKNNLNIDSEEDIPMLIKNKENIFKLCQEGIEILNRLNENHVDIEKFTALDKRNLIYLCDIYNIFEDLYNSDVAFFINSYIELNKEERNFIQEISIQPTREKRLTLLENNLDLIPDIYNLLPAYLKIQISCSGIEENYKNLPMFKNPKPIGEYNPDKFIQEEVYNTFHVGEHWLGKDIKEKLEKIYKKYKPGEAKVQDLNKYFETSYFSFEGTGQYRLIQKLL